MRMKVRIFVLPGVLLIGAFYCGFFQQKEVEKPNLIVVFSDQHSYDMLGCYGNDQIRTPNFDQLASEGIRFEHCISSTPVCSPYRGMLLSGMHPLYNGVLANDIRMLPGNGNHFAEILSAAGYQTGYFGKWHLYGGDRERPIPSGPYRYGFDGTFLSNNCTLLYDSLRSYFWNEAGEKVLYGDWEYNAQTDQALEFLDRNAVGAKPVALFLSWHAPHDWMAGGIGRHKYAAAPEFEEMYDTASITLRENCEDTQLRRLYYQGHMASISSIDRDFGRIMRKLEEKGILGNSLIVFTSDHGDMLESHDWPYNKGRPEIESIRVPLIMKWEGRLSQRESGLLMGTLDLMPTILGLMQLPVPATCQGQDHSEAILAGKDDAASSVPLFYFAGDWRGVYTRDYTYSFSLPDGKAEPHAIRMGFPDYNVLYDHRADRFELNNLYGKKEAAEVQKVLHEMTLEWMRKFKDNGVPYSDLLPRAMVEEDFRVYNTAPGDRGSNWEGRMKGQPVEYQ